MTQEQEMVIRVKFQDTYKAVANYIRNGLGVTRETVFGYIQEFTKKAVEDFMRENPDFLAGIMKQVVLEEMNNAVPGGWYREGLRTYIKQQVGKELETMIKAAINETVKVEVKATEGSGNNAV